MVLEISSVYSWYLVVLGKISMLKCSLNFCVLFYNNLLIYLNVNIKKYLHYSTFKDRRGRGEEIPLVQGQEQWLRFAGVPVKRYPTSKVRETQVRW